MTHTAANCTVATHDHFGQIEAWRNGHGDDEPQPDSDELVCGDCGALMFYDYADDQYHHLEHPEIGCFLIPPEIDGVFQRPWPPRQLDLRPR